MLVWQKKARTEIEREMKGPRRAR